MLHNLLTHFWPWNNQTTTTMSPVHPPSPTLPADSHATSTGVATQEIANVILKAIVNNSHTEDKPHKYAIVIFESRSWLVIRQKLKNIDSEKLGLTNYESNVINIWLKHIDSIEENYLTIQTCLRELNKPNATFGGAAQVRFQQDQDNRTKAQETKQKLDDLKDKLFTDIVKQALIVRKTPRLTLNPAYSEAILTIYSQWPKLWAFHVHEGVTLDSESLHGTAFKITEDTQYEELFHYLKNCGNDVHAVKAFYGLEEKKMDTIQDDANVMINGIEPFIERFTPASPFIGKGSKINYSYVRPNEFYTTFIDDENGVTSQASLIKEMVSKALSTVNSKLSAHSNRFNTHSILK